MNTDVEQLERTGTWIGRCVWAVAAVVMIFSAGTAYTLLRDHEVPAGIAWLLAPAVDVALVAALLGDGALHRHGERVAWGTALRWSTGLFTLGLNTGGAVGRGDWAGVAIHAIAPVLLVILTEAAAAYRLAFARVAAGLRDTERDSGTAREPWFTPAEVATADVSTSVDTESVPMMSTAVDTGTVPQEIPAQPCPVPLPVPQRDTERDSGTTQRDTRPGQLREASTAELTALMREAAREALAAGRDITGAELSRSFGVDPGTGLGRRIVREVKAANGFHHAKH